MTRTPKRGGTAGHRTRAEQPRRVTMEGTVAVPRADPKWAPAAKRWYRSLAASGHVRYFEPSDWQQARLVAELLTIELTAKAIAHTSDGDVVVDVPPRAAMLAVLLKATSDLGTTEASRRRLRIEVERDSADTEEFDLTGL